MEFFSKSDVALIMAINLINCDFVWTRPEIVWLTRGLLSVLFCLKIEFYFTNTLGRYNEY